MTQSINGSTLAGVGNMAHRNFAAVLSFAFLWLLAGCGGSEVEMGTVRGTVTLDGVPLAQGWVHSHPESGRGACGAIQSDGSFELETNDYGKGAVVGTHRLTVLAYENHSAVAADYDETDAKLLVPQKYTQPGTAGFSVVIEPSKENVIDLPLRSAL